MIWAIGVVVLFLAGGWLCVLARGVLRRRQAERKSARDLFAKGR